MPPDAQMLADFADTIAMAQGRKLLGEPEKLVRRSRKLIRGISRHWHCQERSISSARISRRRSVNGKSIGPGAAGVQCCSRHTGSIRDAESRMGGAGQGETRQVAAQSVSISGIVALTLRSMENLHQRIQSLYSQEPSVVPRCR
jgi:hypothetical protein